MRAGPVAAMLERLGAFNSPERFQRLMSVCARDCCAYEGRGGQAYPKATLLEIAIKACADIEATDSDEERLNARAEPIAWPFRSGRWSSELA